VSSTFAGGGGGREGEERIKSARIHGAPIYGGIFYVFQFPDRVRSTASGFVSEERVRAMQKPRSLLARLLERMRARAQSFSFAWRRSQCSQKASNCQPLASLALPHKLNDRLNGWPSRYAKERFFGYFAKYPVKDFDGPLRSAS
jgi:hypothetical protein